MTICGNNDNYNYRKQIVFPLILENLISGEDRLLKPKEVAQLLGISINTLYNWNYLGKLQPIRFSKRMIRYRYSDVKKLIETRETT